MSVCVLKLPVKPHQTIAGQTKCAVNTFLYLVTITFYVVLQNSELLLKPHDNFVWGHDRINNRMKHLVSYPFKMCKQQCCNFFYHWTVCERADGRNRISGWTSISRLRSFPAWERIAWYLLASCPYNRLSLRTTGWRSCTNTHAEIMIKGIKTRRAEHHE